MTVTVNESGTAFDRLCFNPENGGNLFCYSRSAGNAERGFGAFLNESFCIAVAACIAASAAVCTGKTFTDICHSFVRFNAHKVGGKGEKHAADDAHGGNDRHGK